MPDSPFVTILDPAVGTATFLVEVIDVVHKTITAKWEKQGLNKVAQQAAWNEYVPKHLLPRLYGYELMMAPYAIAHMKIGLKLHETGYRFGSDERVHIYLTNTLEEPSPLAEQSAASLFEALGHEAQAVNDVKLNVHFTVVIGNPPYAVSSDNRGDFINELMKLYKRAVESERNIQPLSDDYIKFIRYAHSQIEKSGLGVIGFITNHSYIRGLIHRGMREELLKSFDEIYILDLHGNAVLQETAPNGKPDSNVFDIRQGVSIAFLVKKTRRDIHENLILYSDLFGSRESKYEFLLTNKVSSINWQTINPILSNFMFAPTNYHFQEEYLSGLRLDEIMPLNKNGIQTGHDHFAVDIDLNELEERITVFFDSSKTSAYIRDTYQLSDKAGWTLDKERRSGFSEKFKKDNFVQYFYRPFDIRWLYYSKRVLKRPVREVMEHMRTQNLALIACRQQIALGFHHIFVTNLIGDGSGISLNSREWNNYFPLFIYNFPELTSPTLFTNECEPNISQKAIALFKSKLYLDFNRIGQGNLKNTFGPEDIFHFIYAVLHSPTYRSRYAEFLKIDFPRLPLTSNIELFRELCALGKELVALHLLESPLVNDPGGDSPVYYIGNEPSNPVEKGYPKFENNSVHINMSESFCNIPNDVWEFHIGGYQVCHKWLKDRRGRQLSREDIAHYQKIVNALGETIRLMGEVDAAIESAGGWPIQ